MIKLHTNMGTITLELDERNAPDTVANFEQYVKDGHYANTIFHRVIDGFMIQGGGF
jgi:peptidyl-prolyl cis-trans isomerase B (cyclophilin B)